MLKVALATPNSQLAPGCEGAAATRAAAWLSAAEARLAVDRTTAELQVRLLAALGGDN